MGVKQVAPWHHKGQGARWKRPLAHRRPGYPLAGCSPAEPTSGSPGDVDVPQGPPAHKSKQAAQASWERVAVTRAALSVAKERSFFVQTMGSTSLRLVQALDMQDVAEVVVGCREVRPECKGLA